MSRRVATSPAPDDRCPKCGRGGPLVAAPYYSGTVTASSGTTFMSQLGGPWYSVYRDPDGAKSKPKKRKRRRK